MDKTLIIISDLHIGANDDLDIFKSPTKLGDFSRFVDFCRAHTQPVELIINGDFVDFLQIQPWGNYSRTTALTKAQQIARGSADVFRKLGEILQNDRHNITVLLGNHDVELAYDEVWGEVERMILARAPAGAQVRLRLVNRRITYNVPVNGVVVHVEHGNEGDPWNAIHYGPLFQDAEEGTHTFAYPPGTSFVYDTINGVKAQYRFVDLLKPEVPSVPLILLALRPLAAVRQIPSAALGAIDALANGFMTKLREWISGPQLGPMPTARATTQDEFYGELAQIYSGGVARATGSPKVDRRDADDAAYFLNSVAPSGGTGGATLSAGGDTVKRALLASALEGLERYQQVQHPADFFQTDHPENPFGKRAKAQLRGQVRVVVFGHTHEALKTEYSNGIYINSGTWANLIELPSGALNLYTWLEQIENNSFPRTAFLTYVKIQSAGNGLSASLNHWDSTQERMLWQKHISI